MACMWPQFSYWIEAPIKDSMPIQAKKQMYKNICFWNTTKKILTIFYLNMSLDHSRIKINFNIKLSLLFILNSN